MPADPAVSRTLLDGTQDETEQMEDPPRVDEAQVMKAAIAGLQPGFQRAYFYLLIEVRNYALQLVTEIRTAGPDGEPADDESAAKMSIAEQLERILSESTRQVEGDVERA